MTQSSTSSPTESQFQPPSPSEPQSSPSPRTLTPRQRDARRAAAQKSTGPRTPRGKRFSRRNATRHGHYAAHYSDAFRETILALKEDPDQYDRLRQRLLGSLASTDDRHDVIRPVLALAIEELAQLHWELDRERRRQNRMRDARRRALDRELVHRRAELQTTEYEFPGFPPGGLECTVRDAPSANTYKAILDHLAQLLHQLDHQDFENFQRSVRLLYNLYGEMSRVGLAIVEHFHCLAGMYQHKDNPPDRGPAAVRELRALLVAEREKYTQEYEAFKPSWPVISEAARERARDLESLAEAEEDDPEWPQRLAWEASVKHQEHLRRAIDRKLRTVLAIQREARLQEAHAARLARSTGVSPVTRESSSTRVSPAVDPSPPAPLPPGGEGRSEREARGVSPASDFEVCEAEERIPGQPRPGCSTPAKKGGQGAAPAGPDARPPRKFRNEGTNRRSSVESTKAPTTTVSAGSAGSAPEGRENRQEEARN